MKAFFKLLIGAFFIFYLLLTIVLFVCFVEAGDMVALALLGVPYVIYLLLPSRWQFFDK